MTETQASKTTRTMAYLLMGLFGVCLVTVLVAAILQGDTENNRWFSSFKDGFAFLAGALATIIGYYFGNRNTDVAFERAREASDQAKDATDRVKTAEAKAAALTSEILEVTKASDPVNPTNSPVRDEDQLDRPLRK